MLFPDDAPCDGSLLTNARQADAILRAKKSVDSAVQSLRAGMTPDAVRGDLEAAMDALGEVTGRTMREDITNRIFERVCVGKETTEIWVYYDLSRQFRHHAALPRLRAGHDRGAHGLLGQSVVRLRARH